MKNLILLSLTLALFSLSACGTKENDEKGSVNASGFTDLQQAEIVLTALERTLERKYDYDFKYEAGLFSSIELPPQIPTVWEDEFNMRKQALVYASSLKSLQDHEKRLSEENQSLYNELVNKTKYMSKLIYHPTYAFATRSVQDIESFSFEVEPEVLINSTNLNLYTYKASRQTATHQVGVWKDSSKELCLMWAVLNQFDLNFLSISNPVQKETCASYPKTNFSAQYDEDASVTENMNRINNFIINHYNEFSNEVMAAAGIFLSSSSTNLGYLESERAAYEHEVALQNNNYRPPLIQRALRNNLYENLYFKIEVLIRKDELFGLTSDEDLELFLAERAINTTDYVQTSIRLGHSPFDFNEEDFEGAFPVFNNVRPASETLVTQGRNVDIYPDDPTNLRNPVLLESTETSSTLTPLAIETDGNSSAPIKSLRPLIRPFREQTTTIDEEPQTTTTITQPAEQSPRAIEAPVEVIDESPTLTRQTPEAIETPQAEIQAPSVEVTASIEVQTPEEIEVTLEEAVEEEVIIPQEVIDLFD